MRWLTEMHVMQCDSLFPVLLHHLSCDYALSDCAPILYNIKEFGLFAYRDIWLKPVWHILRTLICRDELCR